MTVLGMVSLGGEWRPLRCWSLVIGTVVWLVVTIGFGSAGIRGVDLGKVMSMVYWMSQKIGLQRGMMNGGVRGLGCSSR